MNTIFAYYKGTSIIYDFENLKKFDELKKLSESLIVDGMRNGYMLNELIKGYVEQLDTIENRMHITFGDKPFYESEFNKIVSPNEKKIWLLNIFALLKLKVINDDKMNGFLLVKETK